MREHKWVARAEVHPQGYARPTETSNPPESFDQALAVAQIRGGKRTSPGRQFCWACLPVATWSPSSNCVRPSDTNCSMESASFGSG